MKKLLLFIILLGFQYHSSAQCKYVWATWTNSGMGDTAIGTMMVNGTPIIMTMSANYLFDFTPTIFNYPTFNPYPDVPPNAVVPRTTWSFGAGGQTTMCFSQPVLNPVLLLASIGNNSTPVTLSFSSSYNVLFDGGGNTFTNPTTINAAEGFCIIEFPGSFNCVTIFSTTYEYYTNITWGIKNPLTAGFSYTNQCLNNTVAFTDTSQINAPGTIIAYDWDFGDGTVSTDTNPVHSYPSAGSYIVRHIATSNSQCHDTIIDTVNVNATYNITNHISLCNGQAYAVNGHSYNATGTYIDTLSAAFGCDSIIETQLTVNASMSAVNQQSICSGTTYVINSHSYSVSGSYYDTLTTSGGCDSIVNTQLAVSPATPIINQQSICPGGSYAFNSHVYTTSGNFYDTLTTVSGCDSIIETQLTLGAGSTTNNVQSICPGSSYTFNSHVYNNAGQFYDTLQAAAGCDSVIITTITLSSQPQVTFSHPPDVCLESPPLNLTYASPSGGTYAGPGVTNNTFNPSVALAGTHALTYTYTDPLTSCGNTANETITVRPPPAAKLSVTPDHATLFDAKVAFIDQSQGTVSSEWDFGDGDFSTDVNCIHEYSDTGHFKVTLVVTDAFGCTAKKQATVFIEGEFAFYVPNSFTPDGDGINDDFSGFGVGVENYSMIIYNRWGEEVYRTEDMLKSWNAKNAPGDTYVYRITLSDPGGNEHEYVGKVSVVR
jgi:gliding motility-associated-like protein